MEPALRIDRLGCALCIVPVTLHNSVAAGANLAGFVDIRNAAVLATDLYFPIRMRPANGAHTGLEGIIHFSHGVHGAAFGLAIRDHDSCKIHIVDQTFH